MYFLCCCRSSDIYSVYKHDIHLIAITAVIEKRKREKRKRDLINHFRVHKFATYPSNGTGRIGLICELTLITLKSYS